MTTLSRRGFLLAAAASLAGCAAYPTRPAYPPLYARPGYYPGTFGYGYGYGHDGYRYRRRPKHHDGKHHDRKHDDGRHDGDRHGHRDDGRKPHGKPERKPAKKPAKKSARRAPTDAELEMRLKGSRNREGVLRRAGRSDLTTR